MCPEDTIASESSVIETPAVVDTTPAPAESVVNTPIEKPAPTDGLDKLKEKIAASDAVKEKPVVTPATTPGGAAAFKANYKFRVGDKDHEIPENFRGLMKDTKSEKEVRELFEKAIGLDVGKHHHENLKTQLQEVSSREQGWVQSHQSLKQAYARGDLDNFFQQLQVPQEKVFQWVLDKVNYNQLPPEQRALIDAQKNADQRAFALENAMRGQQEQFLESSRQAKSAALESCLAGHDIKPVADAFDARVGRPGAFATAIRNHGHTVYVNSNGKRDLSPSQAIQEVMSLYGISAPAPEPAAHAAVVTPGQQRPPVIPNIQGRQSSSPVKAHPRSVEDLKKLSKEFQTA